MGYLSEQNERLAITVNELLRRGEAMTVILWLHGPDPAPTTEATFAVNALDGNVIDVTLGDDTSTVLHLDVAPTLADLCPLVMFDGSVLLLAEFLTVAMLGYPARETS